MQERLLNTRMQSLWSRLLGRPDVRKVYFMLYEGRVDSGAFATSEPLST
jgi:hypothetical protein